MLSLSVQSGFNNVFTKCSFPRQTLSGRTFKTNIIINPKSNSIHSSIIRGRKIMPISRNRRFTSFAASEALTAETEDTQTSSETEEFFDDEEIQKGKGAKQVAKPRLVLKFIWMEKNIGLALDQLIPGYGSVPLSPYFFWPRKDAWEELKTALESKPWISQKKMIILLNQATDIINLWQQSGGNLTT